MENYIPKESETIASKRLKRLARKQFLDGSKLIGRKTLLGRAIFEIIPLIFLVLINFILVYRFSFIPASNTQFSTPFLPVLSRGFSFWGGNFAQSVQIATSLLFILFPVGFYLLIKKITGRKLTAMFSVLIVTLPFYPFAYTRIPAAFLGKDAAHIAALTIIVFGLNELIDFIRYGGRNNFLLSVILTSLVGLTSPFSVLTFIIFSLVIALSEMLLGTGRIKLMRLILVLIISFGLVSFWYNPGFVFWLVRSNIFVEFRFMVSKIIPVSLFTVPVILTFGYLIFDRRPDLQALFIATFFVITFFAITFIFGGIFPSSPSRYIPELGISLSFLISYVLVSVFDKYKNSKFLKQVDSQKIAAIILSIIFMILVIIITTSSGKLYSSSTSVLGYWTEVQKTEIWESRDKVKDHWSYLGYTLSLISLGFLGIIYKNVEKEA